MPFHILAYIIPKEAHQRQSDWSSVAPTGRRCKHRVLVKSLLHGHTPFSVASRSATREAHLRKWEFEKAKHLKIESISTNISLRISRDDTGSRPQRCKSPIPAGSLILLPKQALRTKRGCKDARMRGGCAGKHWEALQRLPGGSIRAAVNRPQSL